MPYAIPPAGNAGIPPWVEHLETLLVAQVVPLQAPPPGEDPPPGLEPPDPRPNPEERLLAVERLREAISILARRRRRRAVRARRVRRGRG